MEDAAILLGIDYILLAREASRLRAIRMSQVPGIPANDREGWKETLTLFRRCVAKDFPNCTIRRNTRNVSIRISDMEEYDKYSKLMNAIGHRWISFDDISDEVTTLIDSISLPASARTRNYGRESDRTFVYLDIRHAYARDLTLYGSLAQMRSYKSGLERIAHEYDRLRNTIEQRRIEHEERERRRREIERRLYSARSEHNSQITREMRDLQTELQNMNMNSDRRSREVDVMVSEIIPLAHTPLLSREQLQAQTTSEQETQESTSTSQHQIQARQRTTPSPEAVNQRVREIEQQVNQQIQERIDEILTRGA